MISKKTKYAIHALVYLAEHASTEKPIPTREIAENIHVSFKFLDTILRELKHVGITASKMGKDGGYYLQKDSHDINLADILRALDGPIALVGCASYRYYQKCDECKDESSCLVKNMFSDIRSNTVEIMKSYSLDKLTKLTIKL